ncbi:MAG: isoprenylcysteine carboxylmethyltransferase family protein [Thermoflexales bacterium]|nr:isoprenylcysteine carboxylmethyltransferase family protein [Thermoflexales bacterium]
MREIVQIWAALIIFAVSHTALASHGAKAIAARLLGARVAEATYRLIYNALALVVVAPALYLAWTLPDVELYRFPAPLDSIALIVQSVAALGLAYSVYQMDWTFFVGLRQIVGPPAQTTLDSTSTAQLVTTGLHRFVRHPLYTTSLIVLYLVSPMTLNRLALVVGIHVYFFVGSLFEERKLVREFGDAYRDYQHRVPRLFPRLRA